jgi:hypothetical protein
MRVLRRDICAGALRTAPLFVTFPVHKQAVGLAAPQQIRPSHMQQARGIDATICHFCWLCWPVLLRHLTHSDGGVTHVSRHLRRIARPARRLS